MQQGIGDAPFLAVGNEGHGLVVEAHDLATALVMLMIEKAHGIADSHFLSAQSAGGMVPDADIGAVEIDGRNGDEPLFAGFQLADQDFFLPEF